MPPGGSCQAMSPHTRRPAFGVCGVAPVVPAVRHGRHGCGGRAQARQDWPVPRSEGPSRMPPSSSCAAARIYPHGGCAQSLPAQDWGRNRPVVPTPPVMFAGIGAVDEAARQGRRLRRVIVSSSVVPAARRGSAADGSVDHVSMAGGATGAHHRAASPGAARAG
jgi:hypothetical protein